MMRNGAFLLVLWLTACSHSTTPPRPCVITTSGGQTINGKVIMLQNRDEVIERYCVPLLQEDH